MTVNVSTVPLVTIAIPTFNRAATYLRTAIESALAQTYGNLDIIVADNGSTDDTEAVVRSYGQGRIRYFKRLTNVAPNENFNFCLTQARGDYFLLLLDDEQIDPDFVETCVSAAGYRDDAGLVRTAVRIGDGHGAIIRVCANEVSGLSLDEFFIAWFSGKTTIYLCSTLFNTRMLRDVGGFRSRHNLFQDVMAHVRIAARSRRVDVGAAKATTRIHEGQFTFSAKVSSWCEDSLDLLELMCQLTPDKREVLRAHGLPFFARVNYSRASMIKSPVSRVLTCWRVYRLFERRYPPPLGVLLGDSALYRGWVILKTRLRGAKRSLPAGG